jgi:hypothetical protein
MGIATKPIAVVVEDDYFQCEQIREILEANNMQVIRCDTAEAAELVVARTGLELDLLVTARSGVTARMWRPTGVPTGCTGRLMWNLLAPKRGLSWRSSLNTCSPD